MKVIQYHKNKHNNVPDEAEKAFDQFNQGINALYSDKLKPRRNSSLRDYRGKRQAGYSD
jgi:hypothetical protein